jgi:hypothetical protein
VNWYHSNRSGTARTSTGGTTHGFASGSTQGQSCTNQENSSGFDLRCDEGYYLCIFCVSHNKPTLAELVQHIVDTHRELVKAFENPATRCIYANTENPCGHNSLELSLRRLFGTVARRRIFHTFLERAWIFLYRLPFATEIHLAVHLATCTVIDPASEGDLSLY